MSKEGFFNQKSKYLACKLMEKYLLPSGKAGYFTYTEGWNDLVIANTVVHGANADKVRYLRQEVFGELWVPPVLTDAEKIIELEKEVARLKLENDDLSWGFAAKSGHPGHSGHAVIGHAEHQNGAAQGDLNFAG